MEDKMSKTLIYFTCIVTVGLVLMLLFENCICNHCITKTYKEQLNEQGNVR